jgi:transposase-like protein
MAKKKQAPIDFTKMENCPVCKVSWQGEPIPQESIDNGFYDASSKFFSKVIGLYSREEDRTFAYRCPSCNITWDRDTNQRIPSLPNYEAAKASC